MIFVKLRGTRILTEGDSRFYTQPEVGRWVASSKCANGSFRMCQWLLPNVPVWLLPMYQYSSFRMYQYIFFRMYIDCHVTKNKIQAGAVTVPLPKHVLISSTSNNQNNGRLPIAKSATRVLKILLVLRPDG
jgi:hypothetical protein